MDLFVCLRREITDLSGAGTFPGIFGLDLAAVQSTWAEMQRNEPRNDPQGFAAISNTGMMLINATLLESLLGESLLGEAPGTFSHS